MASPLALEVTLVGLRVPNPVLSRNVTGTPATTLLEASSTLISSCLGKTDPACPDWPVPEKLTSLVAAPGTAVSVKDTLAPPSRVAVMVTAPAVLGKVKVVDTIPLMPDELVMEAPLAGLNVP